jgi:hypothetical protein
LKPLNAETLISINFKILIPEDLKTLKSNDLEKTEILILKNFKILLQATLKLETITLYSLNSEALTPKNLGY